MNENLPVIEQVPQVPTKKFNLPKLNFGKVIVPPRYKKILIVFFVILVLLVILGIAAPYLGRFIKRNGNGEVEVTPTPTPSVSEGRNLLLMNDPEV
jgi:hypothetical protein